MLVGFRVLNAKQDEAPRARDSAEQGGGGSVCRKLGDGGADKLCGEKVHEAGNRLPTVARNLCARLGEGAEIAKVPRPGLRVISTANLVFILD